MATMNYLLFIVVLATLMSVATSLVCHQCQSLAETTCSDKFEADFADDCDDDTYCVKYKTVVWIRDSGYINGDERESSVVTRSCEPKKGKSEGCFGNKNNGGVTIKCYCGSDGCNSGHSITARLPTTILAGLASFLTLCLTLRH